METRHALEATYKPDLRLARCGRLGASQRALVEEWEAFAWVLGSLALIAGASLTAGAPLQAGFYLFLGLLLLEPLALSRVSARARHFDGAALFAGIAVLMDALLILLLLGLHVEGLGMLTRVLGTVFLAGAGTIRRSQPRPATFALRADAVRSPSRGDNRFVQQGQ
jgi:hypothetical protein